MTLLEMTFDEAADELLEVLEDSEGWWSLQDVAGALDMEPEVDNELARLAKLLDRMAVHGMVYRATWNGGTKLYRV
jgi:prophage antirepressor-like protein